MSLVCFLQQTVCRLSFASSLEEAYFWDDGHADQFDAVYGEWSGHWQAGSTHKSILQTQPLDAEHVHSTSLVDHGEPCSKWNLSC